MRPIASSKNNYHYNKKLRALANHFRKSMTKSEACMWSYLLRAKTCYGFAFRRQRPILNYIVDFCCFELMLIIEVDGISHESKKDFLHDEKRDKELKEIGFDTLRFSSFEVLNCIDDVSLVIASFIEKKIGNKLAIFS
jgi:very-short-patch-repair endonuclease